jgi:peptidoglycan hydrolase-like protein with peptidoglycan-binding domain
MAGEPHLRRGSDGAWVSHLQSLLQAEGVDPGPIDGDFGPRTEAAVRAYQEANGLRVDGIVGPETWGSLVQDSGQDTGDVAGGAAGGDAGDDEEVTVAVEDLTLDPEELSVDMGEMVAAGFVLTDEDRIAAAGGEDGTGDTETQA